MLTRDRSADRKRQLDIGAGKEMAGPAKAPVLGEEKERLDVINGTVPDLVDLPPGCRFAPRCRARDEYQLTICTEIIPDLKPAQGDHTVRCWLYHDRDNHKAPIAVA